MVYCSSIDNFKETIDTVSDIDTVTTSDIDTVTTIYTVSEKKDSVIRALETSSSLLFGSSNMDVS